MFDLLQYKKLGEEFNVLLDKAKQAVSESQYGVLEHILLQNEVLLNRHYIILKDIESFNKNNQQMLPEEEQAITTMKAILQKWNDETKSMTDVLESAKTATLKELVSIQQGKQIMHIYHTHNKPQSRFVDKQQ